MGDANRADPFPTNLPPKDALILLLSDVRTIEQHDEWVEDWKAGRRLLSHDDQVEVAVFAGVRKGDILRSESLREPWARAVRPG